MQSFKELFEAVEVPFDKKLERALVFIGDGLEASVTKVKDGVYTVVNSEKYGGQKELIKLIKDDKKRFDKVEIQQDKVQVTLSQKMIDLVNKAKK